MAIGMITGAAALAGKIAGASKLAGLATKAAKVAKPAAKAALVVAPGLIKKRKEAESSQEIARQDPNIARRMAELDQISRSMRIGSDALTQNKLRETQRLGAQTQGAISRVSGGDVGGTVAGLLRAQRNTQSGVNQALADRSQLPYFQNLGQQLATRMADRRLQLARLQRDQRTAEYAQARKEANLNRMGALATQEFGDGTGTGTDAGGGTGLNDLGQGTKGLLTSPYQRAKAADNLGFDTGNEIGRVAVRGASGPITDINTNVGNIPGVTPAPIAMNPFMQPNFLNQAALNMPRQVQSSGTAMQDIELGGVGNPLGNMQDAIDYYGGSSNVTPSSPAMNIYQAGQTGASVLGGLDKAMTPPDIFK